MSTPASMKVRYAHKMIRNESEKNDVKLTEYEEKNIDKEVLKILKTNTAFNKSNIFGDKSLGTPIEYEKLVITEDGKEKIFEYFNKGIYYMMRNSESKRLIFRVFAFFMMRDGKK
jgi:hypothetical protein